MQQETWTRQFTADMSMSAESSVLDRPLVVNAPVFEGLQVIVSLDGRLSGGVGGNKESFRVTDAGVYLVLASGKHEGYDRYEANTLRRHVKVGIDPDSAQRSGFDLSEIARSGGHRLCGDEVIVLQQPLTPVLKAIATQILTCPLQGALRDMYLAGKGLELTATAAERFIQNAAPAKTAVGSAESARLWYAREYVAAHFQESLSLPLLAKEAGMNVKRLTSGFRQLYGMSVFEFVQQCRLEEAYKMLSTGAYSVSQVAATVGYAIPHFSTLFRRHFGLSPSQLTGK